MKTYLDKLKNVYEVKFNGEYVVIAHTKLHILRPDGTLVACRSDLCYASRLTFLSGNRMLLSSSKNVFHMIDLTTGEDLWTAPYRKNNLNIAPIAISPSEKFAYTYDAYSGRKYTDYFISQLNLETHELEIAEMHLDVGASRDICCEDETTPCLLKTKLERIGGISYLISGVRLHEFSCGYASHTGDWKTKWYAALPCPSPLGFFGSTDKIVTTALHIFTPATGEDVDLLENETRFRLPWDSPKDFPIACWPDHTGQYLCVKYHTGNIIIDIQARKVAATYACEYKRGCLIGSEYWLGTENGIVRKPFPAFEEIPEYNPALHLMEGTSAYYAKHPELW